VAGVVLLPYAVLLLLVDIPKVYLQINACCLTLSVETIGSLQASVPHAATYTRITPITICHGLLPACGPNCSVTL
jgi:hypothetical protein